jgi:hypothetical protein
MQTVHKGKPYLEKQVFPDHTISEFTDENGKVTGYQWYDSTGRMYDAKFTFDDKGRIIIFNDGYFVRYTYKDKEIELSSCHEHSRYFLDSTGRILEKLEMYYTCDGEDGNRIAQKYTYDSRGNIIREDDYMDGRPLNVTIGYTFDDKPNPLKGIITDQITFTSINTNNILSEKIIANNEVKVTNYPCQYNSDGLLISRDNVKYEYGYLSN